MRPGFFKFFSASCAVLVGLALVPVEASAVNISIGVGGEVVPGVYGSVRVDNGRHPVLVYDEPLIVRRPSRIASPIYLHVPPRHLRKWGDYCGRYGACSRPVYFVKSRDYYDFHPRYIEPRYIYRERVTYINNTHHHHRGDFERRDYGKRDYERRDFNRHHNRHHEEHRGHRGEKHWKHDDRRGHHGRGHDRHDRH